jgi:UDP-glucose 4-epimerase
LERLLNGAPSTAYNLGNGNGFSVQEVIDTACRISGRKLTIVEGERRAGDPDRLIADASKAVRELKWQPKYADLDSIIKHAWQWERQRLQ